MAHLDSKGRGGAGKQFRHRTRPRGLDYVNRHAVNKQVVGEGKLSGMREAQITEQRGQSRNSFMEVCLETQTPGGGD